MAKDFLTIVITSPGEVSDEAARISELLSSGKADFVHIRKPYSSLRDIRNLIEKIPQPLRSRLRLHGHFALLDEFSLAGAHLNSRCPEAPYNARSLTRSCHSLAELRDLDRYEYVTLSPIYDSISKTGYSSAFDANELKGKLPPGKVIALGGVTPDRFPELKEAGFAGAALLGAVWGNQ